MCIRDRFGPEGAKKLFGATDAFSYDDYEKIAPKLLSGIQNIYCNYSNNSFEKYDKNDLIILLNDEDVSKWIDNVPYPYLEKHADWWIEIGSKKSTSLQLLKRSQKF